MKRCLGDFIDRMKVPGKKDCNACIASEPDLLGRSWTDVKNYVHNTLQTLRKKYYQQGSDAIVSASKPKNPRGGFQTRKTDLMETNTACNMTTEPATELGENFLSTPSIGTYPEEMTSGYAPMCSTSTNMAHTSQPLISTFTPLNATDTQVVPTFTPQNTTNTLMPPTYTTENAGILPMSCVYTHNSSMPLPPMYAPQNTTPMIPTLNALNAPTSPMIPTFTPLNAPSTQVIPPFSPLNDTSRPIMSSFTPLNHSSTPAYPTGAPGPPATAQVVPTMHTSIAPDRSLAMQEGTPMSPAGSAATQSGKTQKRPKRLWNEEEQAAVRRQLGDFYKLVKVPGKKDCDACLAAEPALSRRTWREVKYYVHNCIQSMKRRGGTPPARRSGGHEPETQNSNTEWDGPVYLSL